jgi:hypothetical protein
MVDALTASDWVSLVVDLKCNDGMGQFGELSPGVADLMAVVESFLGKKYLP